MYLFVHSLLHPVLVLLHLLGAGAVVGNKIYNIYPKTHNFDFFGFRGSLMAL